MVRPGPPAPKRLTLSFVRHVTAPGKYYDQDGLFLTVTASGRKTWTQRLTIQGRRRDLGLGSADEKSPAQARRIAAKNRQLARAGVNPLAPKQDRRRTQGAVPRAITLAKFAADRHRRLRASGTALAKHQEDRSRIQRFVIPVLGRRPICDIDDGEIQRVINSIAAENVNTAGAVHRQLGTIFDEAAAEGFRKNNPARSHAIRVPKRRKRISGEGESRDQRVLDALPGFLQDLEKSGRRPALLLQIRFCLLTLRSPKECRLATWPQIDAETCIWRFPRMQKEGAEQTEVPLHDGLWQIVEQARFLARGDFTGWLFPNPRDLNKPYSANAAYNVPREFGYELKQLDFRRAFEFWEKNKDAPQSLEAWWKALKQ